MAICSSSLSFSKSTYFWPFMVLPGGRKNSQAIPVHWHSTPNHDAWGMFHALRGVPFIKSLSSGSTDIAMACSELRYCRFVRKSTCCHCWIAHFACFLAKPKRLTFMAGVSLGFFTGLRAFKSKIVNQTPTYDSPTNVHPFRKQYDRILLAELIGDRTAVLLMTWSSLGVVFCGRPDLLASE